MFPKKIKSGYESDVTRMLNELLEENPEIHEERQRGRGMWWDKRLDQDKLKRDEESQVKQAPYVYQTY